LPNVDIKRLKPVTPFRKIAIGTWQTAYDPSIYGTLKVRADRVLKYIEEFREKTGRKLTVTHVVTKALALAMKACPEANALLRWNRIYLRQSVDISLLVLMEKDGRMDLSSTKLENVDQMSLVDIVDRLQKNVDRIRKRKDKSLEKTRQTMRQIPSIFINFFLKFIAFMAYTMNWNLKWMGVPRDTFGGAIVTSIGPLGLDIGYVPIVPYSRVPIYVAPGEIHLDAVVEDGQVIAAPTMNVNATFDHRVIDGGHAAMLSKTLREIFEKPYKYFDSLESEDQPAPAPEPRSELQP